MSAFFHAVGVFIHHLRQVEWAPLGLALAFHVTKLLFRARAWENILRASYPADRLRYRSALGAYIAGVGVNSIAPARGGDLIKLYLVKHRMKDAKYPTLASTLIGQAWVSPALEVVFFSLAEGSILYVVIQLFEVCRRFSLPTLVAWSMLLGLLLGFGTDWVLVAAGA